MKLKYYYVTIEVGATPLRRGSRLPVLAGLDRKAVLAAAKYFAETEPLPPDQGDGYLMFHAVEVEGPGKHLLPSLHSHMTDACSFVGDPDERADIRDSVDSYRTGVLNAVIKRRFKEKGMR